MDELTGTTSPRTVSRKRTAVTQLGGVIAARKRPRMGGKTRKSPVRRGMNKNIFA